MKNRNTTHALILALLLTPLITTAARGEAKFEVIPVNDLITTPSIRLSWTWHALGIDPNDNVYVVFGGPAGECGLFQYNPHSGKKRLIGLLSDAAKKAGTLREGEPIDKGHTPLPCINGKIYIGTMPFHDATNRRPSAMRAAEASHGAHIMVYDPQTDVLDDLGKNEPDGVFFKGRGFLCLNSVPGTNLLAGLTVPGGDLLVYDTSSGETEASAKGPESEYGLPVTREIAAAPNGKIFYMYSTDEGWDTHSGHMYAYDINTGEQTGPFDISPILWNGIVRANGGKDIYLCSQPGDLFKLDYENNTTERIGRLFPESDWQQVELNGYRYDKPHIMGMMISADGKSIYTLPLRQRLAKLPGNETGTAVTGRQGQYPYGLFRFDLETRTAERVADVPEDVVGDGFLSGTDIRDSQGNFYFAHHGGDYLGLVKVNPGE